MVATGELADNPSIHIWDLETVKNRYILKGNLRKGVYILKFINNGKYLVCCGL
jgi:hypothetical protein